MRTLIVLCIAVQAAWAAGGGKDIPSWVEELSTRKLPAYSGKVAVVVLLNDQHVSFDPSGMVTTVERRALKVLNQQGRREAAVGVHYWKNRRDIKDLRAWLIAPNGFEKTFDKSNTADYGAFNDAELYTDGRFRVIAADNPEVGSVFASEYTVQQKAITAQEQFLFQTDQPSLQSRYSVTLPAGWTAKGVVFNHAPVEPIVDGTTYTWEIKDLPFREAEDESAATLPRLAVSFLPPAGGASPAPSFAGWADVSRWQVSIAEGQDQVTPEISAKVAQLTAGAKNDYEKICAIGHYVQNIRYVAIEINLAEGGGYVPHSAGTVFSKQYGDCKDKANLMRCMLKAAGVSSYPVAIFSGDKTYVHPEWPSPHQFNHMIVAAQVSPDSTAATAISTPLGKLLIFDPTDEKTPVGDLPFYEQGSYALVLAGERGDLFKMPLTKPDSNSTEVTVDATLSADGSLTATYVAAKQGQSASGERHRYTSEKGDEYKNQYQRLLNERAKGSLVSKLVAEDHFEQNRFNLSLDFASRDFGQLMQGRLLVFNPLVVAILRNASPVFPKDTQRVGPIVLEPNLYRKTVRLKLPAGFVIDEAPVAAKWETEFAKFSLSFKQEPGLLIVTEEMRNEGATLPPSQFAKVKQFYDNCRAADHQNAVLAKN